ncbi:MAG: type I glyceraldehyde-3-phosphate dehydrogenase [Acidimicrobiia bacterium]|nr:type I glyceraldehyde-3-phosphate dehydrogenase [Acidimicrobiia bacterium]
MLRIGLMGFGRIGRNLFRQIIDHDDLQVVAISDQAQPDALTYLLKYDSIYGRFDRPVELVDGALSVDGRSIPFIESGAPGEVDWAAAGVDVVVQAIGERHRTAAALDQHLARGASRVILASTPETPGELPILIPSVNDSVLTPTTRAIAMGSNTAQALAPVLKVLLETFGLDHAYFTTVHAFSGSQRLADVPTSGFRTSRAAGENIIPAETNSPEILAQVFPELAGRLQGMALNVPVPDGSTVDMVARFSSPITKESLNAAIHAAAVGSSANVLEYTEDPIVSSDVIGSTASGVYDSLATMVMDDDLAKLIIWFDNGWGYSARIVQTLERMNAMKEAGA